MSMTPHWKECKRRSFNVTAANYPGHSTEGRRRSEARGFICCKLPLLHTVTQRQDAFGQDASCFSRSFELLSVARSVPGSKPESITTQCNSVRQFIFLLARCLSSARDTSREREKGLGRAGPTFHSTAAICQWTRTGPRGCALLFSSVRVTETRVSSWFTEPAVLSSHNNKEHDKVSVASHNFVFLFFSFFSTLFFSISFFFSVFFSHTGTLEATDFWKKKKIGSTRNKQEARFITLKSEFDGSWGLVCTLNSQCQRNYASALPSPILTFAGKRERRLRTLLG